MVGADTYIISSRIDWAPYYEYAIKAVMDGTEIATDWTALWPPAPWFWKS